ncbi:sigma-54 dependent transcriptional regulator [Noviherbaspirillum sp. CPCC 100848]|uniref:Sigma-54 dependent transcriptional regulator n=1 Tax=Noviherbaspirillum album TaxID=3080276 RepID=A0ABU6JE61_9BURK|nr:sigma-54 dependent transcriptional regulator [Noviherbaspirillum sp. CPCC 100848]MEC4721943.1 sigma-54 dependent transcriptional regulator [Noviherbaspirillum sp. CPCC 100848]
MFEGFRILFVEDDPAVRSSVTETLELSGFEVLPCESAEDALQHMSPDFPGIVISDVRLPRMDGFDLLRQVLKTDRAVPVIVVTGHGDVSMAVQAMQEGAYDFIEKPFAMERLVDVARRAMEKRTLTVEVDALRRQLQNKQGIDAVLLGESVLMQSLRRQILNLASTSADVLLMGETGTGKELVARCLHDYSKRKDGNFVAINCGGLPESLFESEIFGHEAGAYTNASKRRIGKLEHANKGTLLLDEIESMPMGLQIKLLRALQERKIERLGSNEQIPVDFRIVAATKADLKELSEQHKFRSDLYYRLNVAVLELPPLRDRREDIPMLFENFVLQSAVRYGRDAPPVQAHYVRQLMANDWPGNVRELRNAADRFVLGLPVNRDLPTQPADAAPLTLAQQMDIVEKSLIEQALRQHQGRPMPVCETLGIAKKTLYDKLHRHGIVIEQFRIANEADGS